MPKPVKSLVIYFQASIPKNCILITILVLGFFLFVCVYVRDFLKGHLNFYYSAVFPSFSDFPLNWFFEELGLFDL